MMVFLYIAIIYSICMKKVLSGEIYARVKQTDISLIWTTSISDQSISFQITHSNQLLEYIIIGFSDHGEYNNSDACVFRNGKLYDYYIDKEFTLRLDRSQDCELEEITSKGFRFRRRFNSCDIKDYAFEPGTTQFIIGGGYQFTPYFKHSSVTKELHYGQIFSILEPSEVIDNDLIKMKVLATEAHIPAQVTTYWCIIQKVPSILKKKHHVIQMEAIVENGNEHIVHHMEIFLCQSNDQEEYNGDCNDEDKPIQSKTCSRVIAAWSMGEGPIRYPLATGLPLGGPNSFQYLMVEIHYNNVMKTSGIIDNSGFLFTMTEKLREYDAGIMELGLIYSDANSIPPGQNSFPITAHCVAQCTEKFGTTGIHIFASQLHAHLTGRKIWTSHYRDGIKIGEINRDNHYSPHWQHVQSVQPHINILPGDVLSTTCIYDTSTRSQVTFGGYGIEDEMCVNYIYYYPVSDVQVCKSAISNQTLHRYFKQSHGITLGSIHSKYSKIDWGEKETMDLDELYRVSPLNMACLQNDGTLFPNHPTNWSSVPQPVIFSGPYIKKRDNTQCGALND